MVLNRFISIILLLGIVVSTAPSSAAAERLIIMKGLTLAQKPPDQMILLPNGDILNLIDLSSGYFQTGFENDDVLVYRLSDGTHTRYDNKSDFTASNVLDSISIYDLYVYDGRMTRYTESSGSNDISASSAVQLLDNPGTLLILEKWIIPGTYLPVETEPPRPDRTPPILNVPNDITVNTNDPAGAIVNFVVTATDNRDPSPDITCTPGSGNLFPVGETIVNCTAVDNAGNRSQDSFSVTVVYISCDLDGDNDVDGLDLAIFTNCYMNEFGRQDCSISNPCECNLDGDNDVDNDDLAAFAAKFGDRE